MAMKSLMNKLIGSVIILCVVILFVIPLFSRDASSTGITTKIVNGKIIPDSILGFRIGMTRDEVHKVAAKRGMRKNTGLSSAWKACYFQDGDYFPRSWFTVQRMNLGWIQEDSAEGCSFIYVSLEIGKRLKVETETEHRVIKEHVEEFVENLTKELGLSPTKREKQQDRTALTWEYGSGLSLSFSYTYESNGVLADLILRQLAAPEKYQLPS